MTGLSDSRDLKFNTAGAAFSSILTCPLAASLTADSVLTFNSNQAESTGDEEGGKTDVGGGGDKRDMPRMYFMGLISVTDNIDIEIRDLYNNIIATTDDPQRQKFRAQLETLKQLRDGGNGKDGIDELISKLIEKGTEEDDVLKKLVTRSLRSVVTDLDRQVTECNKKCVPCDSCVKPYLDEIIAKLVSFEGEFNRTKYPPQEDEDGVREFVRTELIKYINTNNDIFLRVLREKAREEKVDPCEEQWSNYFKNTLK